MGVKNYPANNSLGLGSPVLVATFALKLDQVQGYLGQDCYWLGSS